MNYNNIFLKSLYKENTNLYSTYSLETYLNNNIEKTKESREYSEERLTKLVEIQEEFKKDLKRLNHNLNKSLQSLKKAIVGERNFTGYIYSTNIPLNTEYVSENNTALVKEGVVLGMSLKESATSYTPLTYLNIVSDTVNIVPSNLSLNSLENITINYQNPNQIFELKLQIDDYLNNKLVLDFKEHQIIEILEDGVLVLEKTLKKELILNMKKDNYLIRFHRVKSTDTQIKINKIGVSKKTYTEEVIYESQSISLNKELEYLCLDICDNNGDNTLINYEIKINDNEYEEFTNNSNQNLKKSQNIIKVNKSEYLNLKAITGNKIREDSYKFYLPSDAELGSYTTELFVENYLNTSNTKLNVVVENDIILNKSLIVSNPAARIFIDGIEETNTTFKLKKGIRSIEAFTMNLNENISLNLLSLKNYCKNIFIKKLVKEIFEDDGGSYVLLNNKDLKDSYNLLVENTYQIFYKNTKSTDVVGSIQIKATLKSIDKKTCPYITKIIVRGL